MFKLRAAIKKDFLILIRDKAGLAVMFLMPILLVVIISSIQNSTFEMVNENKVPVILSNRDGGESSQQLIETLQKMGMFELTIADSSLSDKALTDFMHTTDAVIAVVIPDGFSNAMSSKARSVTAKALKEFGMESEEPKKTEPVVSRQLTMFYNPILQESFRYSVQAALRSAQQFTENRQILQELYKELSAKEMPDSTEQEMLSNQTEINEIPVAKDGSMVIPNTTQHNVPAWTIFAMFFIVVSLSTNVVKEKITGSFVRLKTLPTSYFMTLTAKQLTYIGVAMAQVIVIFALGMFLFPLIGLPALELPSNIPGLILVSLFCGWCAVSYGVLVGVFARTMEQAIGFGAVSVIILAAIGGIMVPSFAMPNVLQFVMKVSPMHWCLEAYYNLFLGGGYFSDVLFSVLPLLAITLIMQVIAIGGLKRQHLI